jgi:hypothetical protein
MILIWWGGLWKNKPVKGVFCRKSSKKWVPGYKKHRLKNTTFKITPNTRYLVDSGDFKREKWACLVQFGRRIPELMAWIIRRPEKPRSNFQLK